MMNYQQTPMYQEMNYGSNQTMKDTKSEKNQFKKMDKYKKNRPSSYRKGFEYGGGFGSSYLISKIFK